MTRHIVDASVFGPLFFNDELDRLLPELPDMIANEQCVVPQHWGLELANQIISGLRRKRMTGAMASRAMDQIDQFPVIIDDQTGERISTSFALASKHGLTIYDAAYLELAVRLQLPLATYDGALRKAAGIEKVGLLPA